MVATDPRFAESGYANPEVLVSTDWVAEHLDDPNVRIVESDEDVLLYDMGHIPGAIKLDWHTDLQDQVERDFLDKAGFEALLGKHGIGNDTTVVFYGDRNNWYATYAYWLFKYFGHARRAGHERRPRQVGGRRASHDARRAVLPGDHLHRAGAGRAHPCLPRRRAEAGQVGRAGAGRRPLVPEYTGEVLHMAGYAQEGAQRGGHVLGAQEHSLGDGRQRGRHLQEPRAAAARSTGARASPRTRT